MPFETVRFFCASCLEPQETDALSCLLTENKAMPSPLSDATHIISNTLDFEGSDGAADGAFIVTPQWIHRSLLFGKLMPEDTYSPDQDKLFSGVVACATELLPQDVEVLTAGIQALGGAWRTGLTRDVTHLFALSTESEKYKVAMHYQSSTKMVVLVPQWFDDTLRLGYRGLSTDPYQWPKPSVLEAGRARSGIPGANSVQEMRASYKLTPKKESLYKHFLVEKVPETTLDVWRGRRILLSSDLDMSEGRREAVEASIRRSGGRIVPWSENFGQGTADEYDVVIARLRWGKLYVEAMRSHKLVGSLAWLFHVQTTGAISAPTDQLLHFPVPRSSVAGLEDEEITITNYTGASRDYIKRLIELMGARFTASMSGKNTAVVAGFISGTKTEKAMNWGIPIINHTWLEDCFVQWRKLSMANEKFLRFPVGFNFSNVLGTRALGRRIVIDEVQDVEAAMAKEERLLEDPLTDFDDAPAQLQIVKATPRKDRSRHRTGEVDLAGDNGDEEIIYDVSTPPSPPQLRPKPKARPKLAVMPDALVPKTKTAPPVAGPSRRRRASPSLPPVDVSSGGEDGQQTDGEDANEPERRGKRPKDGNAAPRRTVSVVLPPEGTGPALSSQPPPSSHPRSPRKPSSSPVTRRGSHAVVADSTDGEEPLAVPSQIIHNRAVVELPSSQLGPKGVNKRQAPLASPISESENDRPLARALPAKSREKNAAPPTKGKNKAAAETETEVSREPRPPTRSKKTAMKGRTPKQAPPANVDDDGEESDRPVKSGRSKQPPPPASKRGHQEVQKEDMGEQEYNPPKKKAAPSGTMKVKSTRPTKPKPDNKPAASGRTRQKPAERSRLRQPHANVPGEDKTPDAGPSIASRAAKRRRSNANADEAGPQSDPEEPSVKKRRLNAGKKKLVVESDESDEERPAEVRQGTSTARTTKGKSKMHSTSDDEMPISAKTKKQQGRTKRGATANDTGEGGSSSSSRQEVRLLTTGFSLSEDVSRKLTKLGVNMVDNVKDCTHLVVNRIARTEKFLCAMAFAPIIVGERWTKACALQRKIPPADEGEDYRLQDRTTEAKYAFTLIDALQRAKENKGRLFNEMIFQLTPRVKVDIKLLKNVILAHGGRLKPGQPTLRSLQGPTKIYVISCEEDRKIWEPLVRAGHSIYTTEIVLTSALVQEIRLDDVSVQLAGPSD